jgi:hypothetical protein
MAEYFIDTASGARGPYSAARIAQGVQAGKIPAGAQVRDAATGAVSRAGDVKADPPPIQPTYARQASAPITNKAAPWEQSRQSAANFYQQQQAPANFYQQQPSPYPQQYPQQYPPQQYSPQYGAQPTNYNPYGHQSPPAYGPITMPTSTMAIVSLVLSLVSIVACSPLALGGVICGIIALKETGPQGPKKGRGLALGGLIVGALVCLLMLFVIVVLIANDGRL